MNISECLAAHHTYCDELFASAEDACLCADWSTGEQRFSLLSQQLEAHFSTEEATLFPAFEAATGMSSGPTAVMRAEHRQMRDLLAQMEAAIAQRDGPEFSGNAETLLILMQQHNMKEENILYPMCDRTLVGEIVGTILQGVDRCCA